MEDDDEFGDLYTDVLRPPPSQPPHSLLGSPSPPPPPGAAKLVAVQPSSPFESDGEGSDDGGSIPGLISTVQTQSPAQSARLPAQPAISVPRGGDDEDWLLGGESVPEEQPVDWNNEQEEESVAGGLSSQKADLVTERDEFRVSLEVEEEGVVNGVLEERVEEMEKDELAILAPNDAGSSPAGRDATETDVGIGDLDQEPVIPGLSTASAAPSSFRGIIGGEDKLSRSDDLDSDSEDDLRIVLNDDSVGHFGGNKSRLVGGEDEDDEDGEDDFVILADEDQHHHHQVMEEQEWGDELMQQSLDGESSEAPDTSKGNGGVGARVGYGSHGFHGQHHSQFKYVRPGVTGVAGGAAVSGGPTGMVRPLTVGPTGGRSRGIQKGFHSGYGLPSWASGAATRAYGSGLEFTLPSHKTIFDFDIDGFEEKPWKLPSIDVSDFFNFGLDEDSWKDYRKQLDQLRLEATMQSKIHVYESGRSEQDYDPDLPPELAAATGVQDMYAGSAQPGKTDAGQPDLIGPGRGAMRAQPQLPTGRAIQVEAGYGERLPSIDTRPARIRDTDAIIEIVLQESIDDAVTSNGIADRREKQGFKEEAKVEDYSRVVSPERFDHSPPTYGGRKRESRKGPVRSVEDHVPDGNGVLPSPPDVSLQCRSNSKSRSPVHADEHHDTSHATGWIKESSCERQSVGDNHQSSDVTDREHERLQIDDDQKEKPGSKTESTQVCLTSTTAAIETATDVTVKEAGGEKDNSVIYDDSRVEGREATHGDVDSSHTVKKYKLTSRVEQPAGDVVDSRVAHSDNSKARSGSSRDHLKKREGGEEEVIQRGRNRQIGDLDRHRDGEKRNSLQRKDDHGRDGTHEMDRSRVTAKGKEDAYQSHQHVEPRQMHHEHRNDGFDRVKEKDSSAGGRQRREDAYGRRGKDENVKRDQDKEIDLRNKNKVVVHEKKGKGDDVHTRKHTDDGDGKGHHHRDGLTRQRGRDDVMSRRETSADLHVKRRKDEEQRRREKPSKEESQPGYRGREDISHSKRERDEGVDHRKREEQTRVRDKVESHHPVRQRDDNRRQREREDRLRFKQPREDVQKPKGREEGRTTVRSSRALDDKTASATARANDIYPPKDGRRHGETHRRVVRVEEQMRSEHDGHEEARIRDSQLRRKEKNTKHERLSSNPDHPSNIDGEKANKERVRRGKEGEVREPKLVAEKRKLEDNNVNANEVGKFCASELVDTSCSTLALKGHHVDNELPDGLSQNHSESHVEEHAVSDEDSNVRRGRSKLERWTSHKERDYSNSSIQSLPSSRIGEAEVDTDPMTQHDDSVKTEDNIVDTNAKLVEVAQTSDLIVKENDRHLDTVAKLKKRSERFKLPMPVEKEATMTKKTENDTSFVQSEVVAGADIKHERPARKRKWSSE